MLKAMETKEIDFWQRAAGRSRLGRKMGGQNEINYGGNTHTHTQWQMILKINN